MVKTTLISKVNRSSWFYKNLNAFGIIFTSLSNDWGSQNILTFKVYSLNLLPELSHLIKNGTWLSQLHVSYPSMTYHYPGMTCYYPGMTYYYPGMTYYYPGSTHYYREYSTMVTLHGHGVTTTCYQSYSFSEQPGKFYNLKMVQSASTCCRVWW